MPTERRLTAQEQHEFRDCAAQGMKLLGLVGRPSSPASAALKVQKYIDAWHAESQGFLAGLFSRLLKYQSTSLPASANMATLIDEK